MNYRKALVCAKLARDVYAEFEGIQFEDFPDGDPLLIENGQTDTQCAIVPDSAMNSLYIIFRGTEKLPDWATNIRLSRDLFEIRAVEASSSREPGTHQIVPLEQIRPVRGRTDLAPDAPQAKMHQGFVTAYMSVQDQIHRYVQQKNPGELTITGHSLGGALATLCAIDFRLTYEGEYPLEIYTFGSPRVGTPSFRDLYNAHIQRSYRVVNGLDIIPGLPRWWHGYRHVSKVDHIGRHFTLKFLTSRITHHYITNYIKEIEALVY